MSKCLLIHNVIYLDLCKEVHHSKEGVIEEIKKETSVYRSNTQSQWTKKSTWRGATCTGYYFGDDIYENK